MCLSVFPSFLLWHAPFNGDPTFPNLASTLFALVDNKALSSLWSSSVSSSAEFFAVFFDSRSLLWSSLLF